MKPKQIDWITVSFGGKYPDKKMKVLISFNAAPNSVHNFKGGTTEGYYGFAPIDFPELEISEDDKEFYDRCGKSFFDQKGEPIVSAYAWAYKPDCMLNKI